MAKKGTRIVVTLECTECRTVPASEKRSLNNLIAEIDRERENNLSSAIRVHVLVNSKRRAR